MLVDLSHKGHKGQRPYHPKKDRTRHPPQPQGQPMTIVYALIARGKAVLAEFTATAGNFPTVTRVLLNRIPAEATRMSYVSHLAL